MYLVTSVWQALPGKEGDFEEKSRPVREALRSQPGVKLVEAFRSNGRYVAVHAYEDEAAYHRVVHDEGSPFNKAVAEHQLESYGRWVSSESGPSVD